MLKGKRQIAAALIAVMAVQIFGGSSPVMAAKKPKLSKTKLTLKTGQKKTLKVKNYKKKIKWSSSKKKVASVSAKGLVRARKKGTAVITAKAGKKKLKCKVKVIARNGKQTSGKQSTTAPGNRKTVSTSPGSIPETSQAPVSSKAPEISNTPGASNTPDISVTPAPTKKPEVTNSPEETETPILTETPAPPVFSKEGGTYDSAFTLEISSAPESKIYYTTDGSDPRTSATRKLYQSGIAIKDRAGDKNVLSAISPNLFDTMNCYTSGKELISMHQAPNDDAVDKCSVIRAVSEDGDGNMGAVATNTYFIGKMAEHIEGIEKSCQASGQKLSVISITMDQADLFDEEKGIYVRGKYFQDSLNAYLQEHGNLDNLNAEGNLTSNFKQRGREWERNCHIEYFESDGTTTACELKQDCGIRIQGNYSRENVQKSFRLYAREDYGVKNFKYPFFDGLTNAKGETMKKFKTLVLRNGGNDGGDGNYKYKDILTQSFIHDLEMETLHGRPCVVYLDGEYWGYYILQDDISDNFLQERRGVVKEDVIAYKGTDEEKYQQYRYKLDEGDLPEGAKEDYYLKDTLDYLREQDFSQDSVYQTFMTNYMSEQSALDYFATNIFLNNGYDWPGKNWEIWRVNKKDETNPYADGLWRFCLYDLDLTTEPTWNTNEWNIERWNYETVDYLYSWKNPEENLVIKIIFTNLLDSASFRQKLKERIQMVAENNYENALVKERAEQYRQIYSPLHPQLSRRFVKDTAAHAEANHRCNIAFYAKRMEYLPELLERIDSIVGQGTGGENPGGNTEENEFGDFLLSDNFVRSQAADGRLVWEGSWTRRQSGNTLSSLTEGMSVFSDSESFIKVTIDDWSRYTNPVLKMYVSEGYASNARAHVWENQDNVMNTYYYETEVPEGENGEVKWIEQEIPIASLKGKEFYINANDATLCKFEIYEKQ